MSGWDAHATNLMNCGHLDGVALLGRNGIVFGQSSLSIPSEESQAIAKAVKEPTTAYSGITVAGKKYFIEKADSTMIAGRWNNKWNVFVTPTKQAIIVGVCSEDRQPGSAVGAIMKYSEYLQDNGF